MGRRERLAARLRSLAVFLDPPEPQAAVRLDSTKTPFEDDEIARKQRDLHAMSLLDPDVHGYVLLTLRAESGKGGRMNFEGHVQEQHWPAFIETMDRIGEAAERMETPT